MNATTRANSPKLSKRQLQEKRKNKLPQLDFQEGNNTLFLLSELAKVHNIKMWVPPSILLGFWKDHSNVGRDRFMWTDPKSGVIRVDCRPGLDSNQQEMV